MRDSRHPDPAQQRRQALPLLLFFDKAKPRAVTDRDLENFVLELYGFWFAHANDDLLEKRASPEKKATSG